MQGRHRRKQLGSPVSALFFASSVADRADGSIRSKMNSNLKRNLILFPVLDWIAEITAHISNKREQ